MGIHKSQSHDHQMTITIGVLALQGAFLEHLVLLRKAAESLEEKDKFTFLEVRNRDELARCDSLIIPGGESTTISFVAAQSDLLEPLRQFVKYATSHYLSLPELTVEGSTESRLGEHALG